MNLATMIKQASVAVNRSALGLAAAAVLGMGVGANAQLPVTDGLIVWLKADAVDTGDTVNQVRLSGSDIYVKQWVDSSLNNHPASNSTEADQPLYIASGLNGQPVLRFAEDNDDNGDRLYLGDLSASFPSAGSVFAVSTINNDGRYNIFGNRNNDERWVANTWNESRPGSFRGGRSAAAPFTLSDWPQSGSHIFSLESSSAAFRVLIDGTEIGNDTGDYNSGAGQNWTIGNRATNGQQLKGDIPELIIFNRILTSTEADLIGGYLANKYGLTGTTYPLGAPAIPDGLTATGVAGAVNLSWTAAARAASYNVKRSPTTGSGYETIANVVGTTYADITGTVDTPYYYVVTATNVVDESGISNEATAARSVGTAKDLLTMSFGALGAASISGTNIVKNVPVGTDVTALAPTYTVSSLATGDSAYPSGTARNFTTPQTYTVTAEDSSTQTYVVKVIITTSLTYDFNSGLQGWTQIWPASGVLWENGYLGSGYDAGETRFGRSPEFRLTNVGDLTFQLNGGQSPLAAPGVAPSAIPELAIDGGGFAGVALRDVAADTYVLSRRKTFSGGWEARSFTAAELAPLANDGKKYTLDYIDYNKGGWGWTYLDNVSIPGTLVVPLITGMTLPPFDPATVVGNSITLRVSNGLDLSALTPAYTISPIAPFATGTPASGASVDFTSGPVNYTLVSEDLLVTNVYTVTIVELPEPASALIGHWVSFAENLTDSSGHLPGTHDGTAAGWNPGGLAYSPDTPQGFAGSSLDLTAGNVAVRINNSSTNDAGYVNTYDDGIRGQCTVAFWAKGFPGVWAPWVSKFGEGGLGWQLRRMADSNFSCFTIRGLDNEDGTGSAINVNDSPATWHHFVGVWDQAFGTRKLFVDGVLSHVNYNAIGQLMALAAGHHVALGARQSGDGINYDSFFSGLLYDVRIYNQVLFSNQVQVVMTTPTVPQTPEAKIKTFGLPGWQAVINTSARTITWIAPVGTDLTALSPTFTLSTGATCDRASGSTLDFSTPQTYRVTSSDSLITAVYTVAIATGYNFNDGTLQGWRNRVWDLAANEGAGGWADLEPNVTNMPLTINGGVIHPASSTYGQLFASVGGAVYPIVFDPNTPAFQFDYHANTMWLRSPEFYLNRTGDLTVQLAQGITHTSDPANEAAVLAEAYDGGWMGVVLRRVSDNAFVLVKAKTQGPGGEYYTTTFTKAELAPYAGSKAYTLDLIISHKGGWGWVTMDNVLIPGTGTPPKILGTLLSLQ